LTRAQSERGSALFLLASTVAKGNRKRQELQYVAGKRRAQAAGQALHLAGGYPQA
jgi:hypothetical protein